MGKSDNSEKVNLKPASVGLIENHSFILLGLIAFLQYFPSLFFGITKLDDYTFIYQYKPYYENVSNFFTSFTRGVFPSLKGPYYRPIFIDSFLLNYQLFGQNILSYHLVNILFHVCAVMLLMVLLTKTGIRVFHAFILSAIFAVHPVLCQAVAWIPGRNDTLLAIFTFLFLIKSIAYSVTKSRNQLVLSCFFLLLALFTKESAIAAIPVAFVLINFVLKEKPAPDSKRLQYIVWIFCFSVWVGFRYFSNPGALHLKQMLHDFIYRLPVALQYLGKVFLPVNLSVYPIQQDIVNYYGIASLVLLVLLLSVSKSRNPKIIFAGLAIFILFMLPAMLIPFTAANPQCYEHRLYLPLLGILILIPQTIVLNNSWHDKRILSVFLPLLGLIMVFNFNHQKNFRSPAAFWQQAVITSPHSPNAKMMMAINTTDKNRAAELFQQAFQINPRLKYLNLRYGVFLCKQDSIQASEKYFLAEKDISATYECNYYLAKISLAKHDTIATASYVRVFLRTDPFFDKHTDNRFLLDPMLSEKRIAKLLFIISADSVINIKYL